MHVASQGSGGPGLIFAVIGVLYFVSFGVILLFNPQGRGERLVGRLFAKGPFRKSGPRAARPVSRVLGAAFLLLGTLLFVVAAMSR